MLDFRSVFLQFIHEYYCANLLPEVDPGTPAFDAVKYHVIEDKVQKRLLASLKCRLQRWSNRKIIVKWCGALWDFIHDEEGDTSLRLRCFRELGDIPPDENLDCDKAESVQWLVSKCRHLIVLFLLKYAQGASGLIQTDTTPEKSSKSTGLFCRVCDVHTHPFTMMYVLSDEETDPSTPEKSLADYPSTAAHVLRAKALSKTRAKRTGETLNTTPNKKKRRKSRPVYPYGPWAAKDSEEFKTQTPFTAFATTLASLYPFLAADKEEFDSLQKKITRHDGFVAVGTLASSTALHSQVQGTYEICVRGLRSQW